MTLQLSQKEKQLLQDQQSHEKVCIQKYQSYAQQASNPQLQQLFQSLAQQEQQHLSTVTSILSGQVPNMNQSQQGQQNQQGQQGQQGQQQGQQSQQTRQSGTQATSAASQADAMLCSDMLMTEKYVSGAYDTAIFEFTNADVRQALNHIQKEEQQHGEAIFNYMSSQGTYNA